MIVQARMSSRRLPGKMMMDLAGRSLLWHILQRAKAILAEGPVVLAIPDTPLNAVLAQVAAECEVPVVAGSEDDVMGRFQRVLTEYPAHWVVRICGDSPLLGVEHLRRCLALSHAQQADVIKFLGDPGTLLQGGEVVSSQALAFSLQTAPHDPLVREHVTAWALQNAENYPDNLQVAFLEPDPDLIMDRKLSIDTPEDMKRMRVLYNELWDGQNLVDLHSVAKWLRGPAGEHWPPHKA